MGQESEKNADQKEQLWVIFSPISAQALLFSSEEQAESYKIYHNKIAHVHKVKDMRKWKGF